jgi:Domain of unknown function (DUF4349)
MRKTETDTAVLERDLTAIDDALASGTAAHEDPVARELQELALALRADTPEARPEFGTELRERVEAGFTAAKDSARARQAAALARLGGKAAHVRRLPRQLLPAAGVALAVALLSLALIALPDFRAGDAEDAGGGGGGGGGGVAEQAPPASPPMVDQLSRGAADGAPPNPPVPPGDGNFAPGRGDRKIERSFSLELEVPLDEMARVAEDVAAVTNRHGGFVLSSSVDTGEDGGGGDFSLRIPTDRLRPALRDLAGLAPVIRQTQEGRDVTREHVTAKDRLQAARAERRSLLRRLEQADTDEEAEAIRRRLELVAGEINGLRGQLRDLRLRTDYAVVTVSLLVDENPDGGSGGTSGSLDDALGDAGDLLVGTAGVLIRVLALALPLGLIALAAWLAARVFRRRRRESALA